MKKNELLLLFLVVILLENRNGKIGFSNRAAAEATKLRYRDKNKHANSIE